jgi:TrmH family RNA methyltransferase
MKNTSQAHITLIRKLKQRKHRTLEGKFLIEGQLAIDQVLKNGILDVESIHINASKLDHFKGVNDKLHLVDPGTFKTLSDTETPQGVLAICKMPKSMSIEEIANGSGIIIATDSIQDPGNMGTIIRSAVWYGAKALLLGTGSVDIYNPKVVRSTAGATGIIPSNPCDLNETLDSLHEHGWEILLLDGNDGAVSILDHPLHSKTVLVVGNEANGISDHLITKNYKRVLLPTKSPQMYVESLNAGVAASIALAIVNK